MWTLASILSISFSALVLSLPIYELQYVRFFLHLFVYVLMAHSDRRRVAHVWTLSAHLFEPGGAHQVAHRVQSHFWREIVAVAREFEFLPEYNGLIIVK